MSEVEELKRSNNSIEKKKRRKKRSRPKEDDGSLDSPRSDDDDAGAGGSGATNGVGGDELSESSVSTHNAVPRAKRALIVGINSPVLWLTRVVVVPWLYHVMHRSCSLVWLLLGAPLMLALLVVDVFVLTLVYAVLWLAFLLVFGVASALTLGCLFRQCSSDESVACGYRRLFRPLFLDVWLDAAQSLRRCYASSGTLFEDRPLDGASRAERDDADDEQRRFGNTFALFAGNLFLFLFVRSLYLDVASTSSSSESSTSGAGNDNEDAAADKNASSTSQRACRYVSFLLFPVVVVVDLAAFVLWWWSSLLTTALFPVLFVATAFCCHTRVSLKRVVHYWCLLNAAVFYCAAATISVVLGMFTNAVFGSLLLLGVSYFYFRVMTLLRN